MLDKRKTKKKVQIPMHNPSFNPIALSYRYPKYLKTSLKVHGKHRFKATNDKFSKGTVIKLQMPQPHPREGATVDNSKTTAEKATLATEHTRVMTKTPSTPIQGVPPCPIILPPLSSITEQF